MSTEIKADQTLDAKGLSCPLPILKTKKAVEALSKDQVLKVETTDPGSKNDMASWAKRTGKRGPEDRRGTGLVHVLHQKNRCLKKGVIRYGKKENDDYRVQGLA